MSTAREHLNWATERALAYFDAGDETSAVASFVSDVTKHVATRSIAYNPITVTILMDGYRKGREAFKKSMEGFNVS